MPSPILRNDELDKIRDLDGSQRGGFKTITLPILFAAKGVHGLERALSNLFRRANEAIASGYDFIILSDRGVNKDLAPIPALLAVAGLHHNLIREGTRTKGRPRSPKPASSCEVASLLAAHRLRRRRDQSLSGAGNARRHDRTGRSDGNEQRKGGEVLRQGGVQGCHEGDVQDGHLDDSELLRSADIRGQSASNQGM